MFPLGNWWEKGDCICIILQSFPRKVSFAGKIDKWYVSTLFIHLYSNRNPAFPLNNTNTFHFVTDMKPYFIAISMSKYFTVQFIHVCTMGRKLSRNRTYTSYTNYFTNLADFDLFIENIL